MRQKSFSHSPRKHEMEIYFTQTWGGGGTLGVAAEESIPGISEFPNTFLATPPRGYQVSSVERLPLPIYPRSFDITLY